MLKCGQVGNDLSTFFIVKNYLFFLFAWGGENLTRQKPETCPMNSPGQNPGLFIMVPFRNNLKEAIYLVNKCDQPCLGDTGESVLFFYHSHRLGNTIDGGDQ